MAKKTENRSLFIYTALIFFAAIIIIIVAFFGQANLERTKPEIPDVTPEPQQSGIAQKAAEISAENAWLRTETERLTKENESLSSRVEELEINNSNGNKFCNIYQFIREKNIDDAIITFNSINPDSLTEEQKVVYNNILKILK